MNRNMPDVQLLSLGHSFTHVFCGFAKKRRYQNTTFQQPQFQSIKCVKRILFGCPKKLVNG